MVAPSRTRQTPQDRFKAFHRANPGVWALFRQFAHEAKQAGQTRFSADAILHRIRWHVRIETRSSDGRKINNDFAAYYARMLMADEPEFAGFFELRTTRADRQIAAAQTAGRLF